MRSRLYWQVYRGVVGVGLLAVLVFTVVAIFFADRDRQPPEVVGAIQIILDTLPAEGSEAYQPAIEQLGRTLEADITLWRGETLVGSTRSHVPPGTRRWERIHGRDVLRVSLPDGRRVGLSSHHMPARHRHLLGVLVMFAVVIAVGSMPIARRVTRRLEDVRTAMDAWGAGALEVRAPVEGEDEVAQVARTFNAAADRLVELVEGQRRMLASTSHELRTPLTRVRLALELMDGDADQRRAMIADAVRDIEELDAVVGELLDIGRLQGHGIDGVELSVLEVVREVAGDREVSGEDFRVVAERRLLRRAVRNLVDNALRHGGGEVELRVSSGRIEVLDRGPGIAVEDGERVFEPFHRPEGHAEGRDGGVGLGLWLVREIAHAHGGQVAHQPREGGGTVFCLELPLVS